MTLTSALPLKLWRGEDREGCRADVLRTCTVFVTVSLRLPFLGRACERREGMEEGGEPSCALALTVVPGPQQDLPGPVSGGHISVGRVSATGSSAKDTHKSLCDS